MDDLKQKLNELLESPDGMQKLQAAAASLGILKDSKPESHLTAPAVSADNQSIAKDDISALTKLLPLMENFRKDDQDMLLLKAIRPYLQDTRQSRLDEAIKVMHMLKILPLLKDKGIF